MDLSSDSSQTSEQQQDLHGSTLQIYWYILTQRKKTFSYSEIQEIMGYSSKSSAIYQLDKLCELQILKKTGNGYNIVSRPKPRALQPYIFIKFIVIPKALIYGLVLSIINLLLFLLFNNGLEILYILLASIPNLAAIILFFSEAVLVWRNRPKPPHSIGILRNNRKRIVKTKRIQTQMNRNIEDKSIFIRMTKLRQILTHNIKLSKTKIRFFISIVIILFLILQTIVIGSFLGSWNGSYTVQINKNIEIILPESLPIQFEKNGFIFHTRSLYALGKLGNETSGLYLFEFDFNYDLNMLKSINKYQFPSDLPPLGTGLGFSNGSFWILKQWEDKTKSQQLFCFTKNMSVFANYSLETPSIVHSMNLDLSRLDFSVWNDSICVLEWSSDPNNGKLQVNVSIYSTETFSQVRTFSVPVKAKKLFFDNHGRLWLCEFDNHQEASFVTITPDDGTILFTIPSLTFPSITSEIREEEASFYYYPIIVDDTIILPLGDDLIRNLWGFQILSYELSPFLTVDDFFWILLIITSFEGGVSIVLLYAYSSWKRKKKILNGR